MPTSRLSARSHRNCRPADSRSGPASSARRCMSTTRRRSSSGLPTWRRSTSSASPRRRARTSRSSTSCGGNGVLVDAVSAGEIHRAMAAGFKPGQRSHPPEIVYTADIFDREALDLVVEHDIHVNCGSPDMIDQLGERAPGPRASRCGSTPASATATARRRTPAASNRSTASGTSSSTTASSGPTSHGLSITGLHMHIGSRHRPGAPEPGLRRDGAGGARGRPRRSRRSAPAAACRRRIARASSYVDLAAYFELWDATRQRLADAVRPRRLRSKSSRAATWSPRAAT